MTAHADKAVSIFSEGFNCAQSVLVACGEGLGLDRDVALRLASPFGGGMGRMGLTCGAVAGAFMAIGLKYAKTDTQSNAARDKGYELVRRFAERFKQRHGSLACRDLTQCDLSTSEGFKQALDKGVFKTVCVPVVRDAVEIVEELLAADRSEEQ